MTKLPPRNLRAEEFLLGILLRCPAKLAEVEVEGLLAIDDYSKSFHGRIHQTIADMRAAGEPVIPLTVTNKMIQDGTWEKDTRLTLLSDLDAGCPPVDDVTTWARRVREALLFRQVHEEATRLAQITTSESMDRYANACDAVDQLFTLVTHGFAGVEEPWDPPRPLNVSIPPLPDIPGVLGDVVTHVADVTQSPPDLAYLTALGTITAATLGQITVQLKSGWEEPLTIFTMPAASSGVRKSQVRTLVAGALDDLEKAVRKDRSTQYRNNKAKYELLQRRVVKAEQKAAACYDPMGTSVEAADAEQTYLNLRKQLAETDEPHEFKLIADDITPEKLGVEMAKQGGSLAILTAEGGFLGTIGGRYADGMANLDLVLKSYSGELVKVDRVGRDSIEITHPLLMLVLIVQPDVVHELTANRTFVQRGLAARFLYALPVSTVGYRSVHEADLNIYLMNKWKGCIREIFDSPSRILYPSAEARERFDAFRAAHERRLAPYTGDLDQIVEWGSKLPGQVARIAGIYTLIANPQAKVVDDDAMRGAIGVADYLAAHAMAALVATPQNKAASELGDWIRDEKLRRFTVRDAQRALHRRTWCTDADAVRAAARVLERYGWVRHVPPSAKVTEPRPIKVTERGGRPAETYRVNPDILIHDVGLPPGSITTCYHV